MTFRFLIRLLKVWLVFILAIFTSGCIKPVTTKLYSGEPQPISNLSIINQLHAQESLTSNIMGINIFLHKVDGQELKDLDGYAGVELLPGKHSFEYRIQSVMWFPIGALTEYEDDYQVTFNLPKGKKGIAFLDNPDIFSSSKICMLFTDIEKPYVSIRTSEFPLDSTYDFQCSEETFELESSLKNKSED